MNSELNTNKSQLTISPTLTVFLLGEMCSGKDYLGKILCDRLGFTRLAFADALKQEVATKHGITIDEINAKKAIYRPELQEVGESRRKQDLDYWFNQFWIKRDEIDGPVVCTDTRYINEALGSMWMFDSVVVRIMTPKSVRRDRAHALYGDVNEAIYNHPSESQVPLCPFNVVINGTLDKDQLLDQFNIGLLNWHQMGRPIFRSDQVLDMAMNK